MHIAPCTFTQIIVDWNSQIFLNSEFDPQTFFCTIEPF